MSDQRQPDNLYAADFYLRPWQVRDAAWYVAARDEEIFRWTTEKRSLTVEETEAAIQRIHTSPDLHCFAIVDRHSGELLGNIALTLDEPGARSAEVMYWVAPSGRGRGIATGAVNLLCRWAFKHLELERIWLKTLEENQPSQRVARRAGFTPAESAEPGMLYFERVR